jgi:tRNASer (uridine44-2'-O)-methyltransferase
LCLWRAGPPTQPSPVHFVDLGCGNGLLTHLLTQEGHRGIGIDLAARKVWQMYDPSTRLIVDALTPAQLRLAPADTRDTDASELTSPAWLALLNNRVDWIIGNHADELVPW